MHTKLKYLALIIFLIAIGSIQYVAIVNADIEQLDDNQEQDVVVGMDGSVESPVTNDEIMEQEDTKSEEYKSPEDEIVQSESITEDNEIPADVTEFEQTQQDIEEHVERMQIDSSAEESINTPVLEPIGDENDSDVFTEQEAEAQHSPENPADYQEPAIDVNNMESQTDEVSLENDEESIVQESAAIDVSNIESQTDEVSLERDEESIVQESASVRVEATKETHVQVDTNRERQEESISETNSDVASNSRVEPNDEVVDPNCPNRSHIIKCAGKYLDTDFDGRLSRAELDTAIGRLPWFGRGILTLLGSSDKMMQKCDVDKDGFISMDYDMINNADTCLASCFKRRAFKSSFFPDCNL